MSRFGSAECGGFSLVEIVLALGVAAFCLATLFALLPAGMRVDETTLQQTIASNLATAIDVDLRSAPLGTESYTPGRTLYSPRFRLLLPALGTVPQTIFVTEQGVPLTVPGANLPAGSSGKVYRVDVLGLARVPGTQPQRRASPFYLLVTWPGQADPSASQWPNRYAGSFETVSYLDQN